MNYYELLNIPKNASKEEIKNAYKVQMKKWHPDINKSSEAVNMSSKINEAKEVLLDDEKRKDYDMFLENKVNEDYQKYTQMKKNANSSTSSTGEETKNKTVTKWQYLSDWLKYSEYNYFRKLVGVIGVLLESFFCFIIKILLIGMSFLCNIAFDVIWTLLSYIYPILILMLVLLVIMSAMNGFSNTIKDNKNVAISLLVTFIVFVSSFVLPKLSRALISPKVFDILYNKIDVKLFKICVAYGK